MTLDNENAKNFQECCQKTVLYYRKVPNVMTLVTLGFSSLSLWLLLEGRFFQVTYKPCTAHRPFEEGGKGGGGGPTQGFAYIKK